MSDTFEIGGGDDWIEVSTVTRDHQAVGPTVGNCSTCRVCKGSIIYEHVYGADRDPTRWVHVEYAGENSETS